MPYSTLPDVTASNAVRASWGQNVKANQEDHEARVAALESGGGGTGDVVGPASAVANNLAAWDGTTGKLLKDAGVPLSGSNTGDVTLAGTPNYLTIAAQVITRALINLASHVTGRLPFANLTAATSATRLLGRGSSSGAGDFEEIALGAGLNMSGNTLSAPGGGGAAALDDLTDVIVSAPATNDVLQYNGSAFVNQPAANLNASNLASGTVPDARMPALTGDVTTAAGAVATTIANDAVSYAKIQNVSAASKLLGRGDSGAGDPQEITLGTNLSITGTTLNASAGGGSGDETTTAAKASRPAASNDGNLFLPNDSFYLERDTGAAFAQWGPSFPMIEPIDGDFAWINQGGASVDTTKGGVFLSAPTSAGINWRIRKKAAPSTPYVITAWFIPFMLNVLTHRIGLLWRQSSDGKLITAEYSVAGATAPPKLVVNKWTNATTFSAEYTNRTCIGTQLVCLRIADDGTNRIVSYSQDGQHFFELHSVGRTDFLTADEVGFAADSNNATFGCGMTLLSWRES